MYLNEECNKYRQNYTNTKTQLRFNNRDIEVLVKTKGSTEPYCVVPYEEITDPKYIPKFEHNINWENRSDSRPLRKKLVPFCEDSDRMEEETSQNAMTRQRSVDSKTDKAESKKQKLDASCSSSESDSEI